MSHTVFLMRFSLRVITLWHVLKSTQKRRAPLPGGQWSCSNILLPFSTSHSLNREAGLRMFSYSVEERVVLHGLSQLHQPFVSVQYNLVFQCRLSPVYPAAKRQRDEQEQNCYWPVTDLEDKICVREEVRSCIVGSMMSSH